MITPRGLNKLWAFRRQIYVPLRSIREVKVASDMRTLPKGLRLPGSAVPGLVLAGTYRSGGEKSFYVLRDGKDFVLMELQGGDYSRVAFQTRDPYQAVNRIYAALPSAA